MTEVKQFALPGMELGTPSDWILTIKEHGITYNVLVEAMTKKEATRIFQSEFALYEMSVEDEDFDWDSELVWARSLEDAEQIALDRKHEYMNVTDSWSCGNNSTVISVDPKENVDGWKVRRAKRERKLVA